MEDLNPRPEKLQNPDIEQLKNLISNRIELVGASLKECLEELHKNHEMLRNFEETLKNFREYNTWVEKMNADFPEEKEHITYSTDDIREIVDTVTEIETELQQLNSYIAVYTEIKSVFQAQLDQLDSVEHKFKEEITTVKPEELQ